MSFDNFADDGQTEAGTRPGIHKAHKALRGRLVVLLWKTPAAIAHFEDTPIPTAEAAHGDGCRPRRGPAVLSGVVEQVVEGLADKQRHAPRPGRLQVGDHLDLGVELTKGGDAPGGQIGQIQRAKVAPARRGRAA